MPVLNENQQLPRPHCRDCALAKLCLPIALSSEDINALDTLVKRRAPLKKGEFLFRQGDSFNAVFAVRFGTLKTFNTQANGLEQITGFHLAGELLGLSAIDNQHYPISAQALEDTAVCELLFEHLDQLAIELPQLRRELMHIMSREIRDDQQMILLLAKKQPMKK